MVYCNSFYNSVKFLVNGLIKMYPVVSSVYKRRDTVEMKSFKSLIKILNRRDPSKDP